MRPYNLPERVGADPCVGPHPANLPRASPAPGCNSRDVKPNRPFTGIGFMDLGGCADKLNPGLPWFQSEGSSARRGEPQTADEITLPFYFVDISIAEGQPTPGAIQMDLHETGCVR